MSCSLALLPVTAWRYLLNNKKMMASHDPLKPAPLFSFFFPSHPCDNEVTGAASVASILLFLHAVWQHNYLSKPKERIWHTARCQHHYFCECICKFLYYSLTEDSTFVRAECYSEMFGICPSHISSRILTDVWRCFGSACDIRECPVKVS